MSGSVNNPQGAPKVIWHVSTNYGGAQTNAVLKAAPGTGLSLYITDIIMSNGPVAGNMKLVEKTASATDIVEVKYFAINGGLIMPFRTPIKLSANENLGITTVNCTDHSVTVCGFTAP